MVHITDAITDTRAQKVVSFSSAHITETKKNYEKTKNSHLSFINCFIDSDKYMKKFVRGITYHMFGST